MIQNIQNTYIYIASLENLNKNNISKGLTKIL